jgi:hypothetical protein
MAIIILWLIFGAICYLLAERKGRNKITGFLAGILFGVFALIYYLVVGEPGKICPFCKEKIKKDATVCPHCQRELDVVKK